MKNILLKIELGPAPILIFLGIGTLIFLGYLLVKKEPTQ
jgi:Na+-transporting methylmalonyl-CoA/oxaloacetate decarboxylase beta subunit